MSLEQITLRGRAHTRLRAELGRQGALHGHERELLLDAADALLFDEPESGLRRTEALELLNRLQAAMRRTRAETERLRVALEGCGAPPAALAA
jgi:ABC-type transport system involved in cytochrome bd biosynthesis fused ATPase/permease subunit